MLNVKDLRLFRGLCRLDGINFTVERGSYFVLLGHSGAGKTLLLEALAGLTPVDGGFISLNGRDITHERASSRGTGLVYQDHALFPHMTVRRNIGYPLNDKGLPWSVLESRILDLAGHVGASQLLDRMPETLSEGESQRVALARTLASEPQVLMLDEPLASLDIQARAGIRSLLRRLNREGRTILHVTHDYEEAVALASTVAVLENGGISQIGTPDEVFHHPRSQFVANFVGIRNFLKGRIVSSAGDTAEIQVGSRLFSVPSAGARGDGCMILRSEDITLSAARPEGSARNCFEGTVVEVESLKTGIEVAVDAGVTLYALITRESMARLAVQPGRKLWISFKATAVRFIPDSEETAA